MTSSRGQNSGADSTSTINVAPLTLHIGAEIRGVDLTKPLPFDQLRDVRAAFLKWKVVFFRDQHLDHAQHVALARQFGEPTIGHAVFGYVDGHPEIYSVAKNRTANENREAMLVTVHAETGERVLYVSPSFLKSIVGLTPRESQKILEILWEHVTRPEYTVRFKWNAGDIAFWDNRSTVHLAPRDIFESDFERQLYRITLVGEPLVGVNGKPSQSIEGLPILSAAKELRMMAAE